MMKCADCNTEMVVNSKELTDDKEFYWIEYECPKCECIEYKEEMA